MYDISREYLIQLQTEEKRHRRYSRGLFVMASASFLGAGVTLEGAGIGGVGLELAVGLGSAAVFYGLHGAAESSTADIFLQEQLRLGVAASVLPPSVVTAPSIPTAPECSAI